MTREEAKRFIYSRPEWKKHFVGCALRLFPNKRRSTDIEGTIKGEEEKFLDLIKKKEPILLKYKNKLDGKVLSWLHHTHGINPDLVEEILQIKLTEQHKKEYEKAYLCHQETGKLGLKKEVIRTCLL